MSKQAVIVYKEPNKEPEFRKIDISNEEFKKLVGGDFLVTPYYKDYVIIHKKDETGLIPNVYINTEMFAVGKTLKGIIFAINQDENGNFKTLQKEQAIKCYKFFKREAFNCSNDVKGKVDISQGFNQVKNIVDQKQNLENTNFNTLNIETERTLKLILEIQTIILKFIKVYMSESEGS